MGSLVIVFSVLLAAVHINMESTSVLDDILVYPIAAPMKMEKQETSNDPSEKFKEFIEEKLAQFSQALEHIIKNGDYNGEMIKQVSDYLAKNIEKPKSPAKVEPRTIEPEITRRSNNVNTENPIVRLGQNIPKYGRLAKDLFMGEIHTETDPTPLVERNPHKPTIIESGRRSNDDSSGADERQQHKEELSSWCQAAMSCEKTYKPICGFDDNYGYGRFDDICHMLHVNCYYKYNFVLAHTCHPMI